MNWKTNYYHILELKGDTGALETFLTSHFGMVLGDCNYSGVGGVAAMFIAFEGDADVLSDDFDPWLNTTVYPHMGAVKVNLNNTLTRTITNTSGATELLGWRT